MATGSPWSRTTTTTGNPGKEKKMNVSIQKINSVDELHCHYDRQTSAQPCYVSLDCETGILTASYNAEIGNSVPADVYHGHTRRYGIPLLTPTATNDLLENIAPLAQRVVDGYESVWNGNNHVARLNGDATEADEEIERLCDECEPDDSNSVVQEWDAGDYLDGVMCFRDEDDDQCRWNKLHHATIDGYGEKIVINADTTDSELSDIEDTIKSDCDDNNVVLNGLSKYLDDIRDQCRDNADE